MRALQRLRRRVMRGRAAGTLGVPVPEGATSARVVIGNSLGVVVFDEVVPVENGTITVPGGPAPSVDYYWNVEPHDWRECLLT